MKIYRYTNLLGIFVAAILAMSFIISQVKAFFDVPTTHSDPQPVAIDEPVDTNQVEDYILKKATAPEPTNLPEINNSAKITPRPAAPTPNAPSTPNTNPTTQSNACATYYGAITIGGKTSCLVSTATTAGSLSYNHSYILNTSYSANQFIFGHNSSNLFGHLKNLGAGTVFTLTIGGETTSYKISLKETVCDYTNRDQWGENYDCANYPEPVLNMNHVVNPRLRGADLAIMTCAGTALGSGDATHRLVIYANRI